jgi:hypothetical protein
MQAWVRYVGVAVFALQGVACSDKGDSDPGEGSGATGSGGSGSGGSGGSSGTSSTPPVAQFKFDADEEGWAVLTGDGASEPATLQETTTVEHAADEGNPDPGSLKVTVPFDGALQSVGVVIMPPDPESWDYTGKKLSFKVMLESGLTEDAMNPGGVRAFAKGGPDWTWAAGTWTNAGIDEVGSWLTPTLDFTNPSESMEGYDPAQIRQIGIQILTGGTGEAYESAVVYVDTATVQ